MSDIKHARRDSNPRPSDSKSEGTGNSSAELEPSSDGVPTRFEFASALDWLVCEAYEDGVQGREESGGNLKKARAVVEGLVARALAAAQKGTR